jgi:DNA-binding transcriptional regulator of glucitol operon
MGASPRPSASSSPAEVRSGSDAHLQLARADAPGARSKWWTPRAISLHVTLALSFPGFLALGWWQLHRALAGNELSWAYTFEWPFFAGYAVYVWWRIIHDEDSAAVAVVQRAPSLIGHFRRRRRHADADDASDEAALAQYNAYLASLRAYDKEQHRSRGNDEQ